MTRTQTPVQLAHQIWPRLVVTAEDRGSITRKTLAKRFGIRGQALTAFDRILAPLESYCRQHGLPPLYALIVNKETDLPGQVADAPALDVESVYTFPWRTRSPIIPTEDDFAAALA